MRTIQIPLAAMIKASDPKEPGAYVRVHVMVDWPELRLTSEEAARNAIAFAQGVPEPHPRRDIILVLLPRPFRQLQEVEP